MKILNKKFKASIVSCLISVSFGASSAEAIASAEYKCSDEEVGIYLSNEGLIDRSKLGRVSYEDYQNAFIMMKAKDENSGGCWATLGKSFDFSEYAKQINDIIGLMDVGTDPMGVLYNKALEKLKEEFEKTICERLPALAEGSVELVRAELNERKAQFDAELNESSFGMLQDDRRFDNWIEDQVNSEINDPKGLIEWRKGTDGDIIINNDSTDWNKALDDIF
jgi:hypothetical protein